jgi:hypothetical protein
LRIEFPVDDFLVLPYDEFHLAELKGKGVDHHLKFVFSMHEVIITGQNLKRVLIAMQKQLAFIAPVPINHRLPLSDGGPAIQSIVVTEAKPANQKPKPDDYSPQ